RALVLLTVGELVGEEDEARVLVVEDVELGARRAARLADLAELVVRHDGEDPLGPTEEGEELGRRLQAGQRAARVELGAAAGDAPDPPPPVVPAGDRFRTRT